MKSDKILVERCLKKDPLAWAELVNKYSCRIDISAQIRLKKYSLDYSKDDIDDIRQNLLASIWKGARLAALKERSDISYWIATASGNAAIDYMRRKASREAGGATISIHDEARGGGVEEMIESIASRGPTPLEKIARDEIMKSFEETLRELSAKDRLIVKLNLLHQKTHDEIAEITRSPCGTVSCVIKRAKERLQEKLKRFLQEF
jgi:RNA polymerase sigma factor (sigma-70 family)